MADGAVYFALVGHACVHSGRGVLHRVAKGKLKVLARQTVSFAIVIVNTLHDGRLANTCEFDTVKRS